MYVSVVASNSQTATITTEHTLNSPAVAGRFKLIVDTSVMQAGDVLELRAKQVVLTGGTLRVVDFAAFYGVQPTDDVMKTLEIVDNELVEAGAVSFTLKQTFGTGRVYPWKVLNLTTTPANISALSIDSSGRLDIIKIAGTTQTARDIGASVLLSSGAGTGQLDFTSGVVKANATQFAGQTITAAAGVTLPTSVASPTNITAGTITTVTNLTNAATAGDLTSTMKTSVTTAATAATPIAASVTGAVGSVTGNVGGNVTGSVGSITTGGISAASFAAGAIDNAAIATDAIGSAELAATAVTEIQSGLSTHSASDVWAVATRVLTAGTNIALAKGTGVTGFNDLSAAQVNAEADTALADAGVTTTITGRIDVATSTRLADADYTAPDNTSITAIKGKTDNLPSDPADASDIAASFSTVNSTLSTIAGYVDTEVAAIKLKTDLIPASPAAVSDIPTANANADALLDRSNGVETGLTLRGALRLALAALAGKASGMDTTTAVFRNAVADSKNRITATVDTDGNRSAITIDLT